MGLPQTKSVKEAGIGNIVDEHIEEEKNIIADSNLGNDAFQTIAIKRYKLGLSCAKLRLSWSELTHKLLIKTDVI